MPTTKEMQIREKQIAEAMVRQLGDKDINHMIKEKERFMVNPRNYAMYKSRLIKDRDNAVQVGDETLTEELNTKLAAIEERAEELDKARSSKISSIALINDKNRRRNIERAEIGIREEMARKKREGEVQLLDSHFFLTSTFSFRLMIHLPEGRLHQSWLPQC